MRWNVNGIGIPLGEIIVTFPDSFTVNPTAANWTVSTSDLPSGSTPLSNVSTATSVDGQSVAFNVSSNIANEEQDLYCFNFSGINTLTTGPTGIDQRGTVYVDRYYDMGGNGNDFETGQFATAIISNDQVQVSAMVPPSFTFALNSNAQNLGQLSASTVTSGTGVQASVITNSPGGWTISLKSENGALKSAVTGGTIPSSAVPLQAGTAGYVVDADITTDSTDPSSGAVSINYLYNGDTSSGGAPPTAYTAVAKGSGPTDFDAVTLIPRVAISSLTPAATDYRDIWTVVAHGNLDFVAFDTGGGGLPSPSPSE